MTYDIAPIEFTTEEHVYGFAEMILGAHDTIEQEQTCFCEFADQHRKRELIGILSSLVTAVFVGWYDNTPRDNYVDVFAQASDIGLRIAKRHAFSDGNKRTAISVVLTTLRRKGITVQLEDGALTEDNDLYQWVQSAVSEDKDISELAEVLRDKAIYSVS